MAVPIITPLSEPQPRSAVDQFCAEVRRVPGVLGLVRLAEGTVRVHVSDRRGPAGDAVREIEERINREFPNEFVDAWLSEAPPTSP